jgi:hypothetical protein
MRILKELGYWVLVMMGLPWVVARFNRRKTLVLEYHDVYARAINPALNFDGLHVRVRRFESQMRYLAARYHVVGLEQLLAPQAASKASGTSDGSTIINRGSTRTMRNTASVWLS